jgi:hypothetical protein
MIAVGSAGKWWVRGKAWPLRAALVLVLLLGCGDGVVLITFNTGTIVDDPICEGRMGRFDLREQGGLVLVVLVNDGTQIFLATGFRGSCADLTADALVQVRGPRTGDTVTAQSVQVQ